MGRVLLSRDDELTYICRKKFDTEEIRQRKGKIDNMVKLNILDERDIIFYEKIKTKVEIVEK